MESSRINGTNINRVGGECVISLFTIKILVIPFFHSKFIVFSTGDKGCLPDAATTGRKIGSNVYALYSSRTTA